MAKRLTLKQLRFIDAYMATGNGTEAARQAGYKGSYETLAQNARDNLRKPHIAAEIALRQSKDPLIATAVERQRFWSSLMRGINPRTGKDDANISHKIRLAASRTLAQASGDFVNRTEVSGPEGGAIRVEAQKGPDLSKMTPDQIERYEALMQEAAKIIDEP